MHIAVFFVHLLLDNADTNYTLTVGFIGYRDLLQRGKEVNETPQQSESAAKVPVLRAECDPSLKDDFKRRRTESGFRSETDAIITLSRDFVAGKIQYKGGVLQCQQENSQPGSTEGQGGPPAAPEPANEKIKASAL